MFRLHDNTRRRICLGALLALGIVPTALVAGWSLARHLPGHAGAEARRLTRVLGLQVRLEAVEHLRPGAVLYKGLELADRETGQAVLRCRLVEAAWKKQTDAQGESHDVLVLLASQPTLEADALPRLGEWLQSRLKHRSARPDVDVRISAGQLTLRSAENSQTLTELHGGIETRPGGSQARLAFRLAGVDTPEPIRVRLGRNRQSDPPTSGFELDTGGGAGPVGVLAMGPAN